MTDPVNLDQNPDPLARLVREVPTRSVQREALVYVLDSGVMDGVLRVREEGEARILSHRRDGWNKEGRFRVRAPLPKDLWRWRYEIVTLPDSEADLAPYLSHLVLGPQALIDLLPDVLNVHPPFAVVREHVRDLVTDLDPEGSYFVPARLSTEDGGAVPGRWWHWLPRRRLTLVADGEKMKRHVLPFTRELGVSPIAWQLLHDPGIRAFVRDLPVWGGGLSFSQIAFNRPTFAALKTAGVTGLVESTATSAYDTNDHESVGHIV